ncbi:MAG: penicillin-binding protein 1C [Bacteroidota bacterium]
MLKRLWLRFWRFNYRYRYVWYALWIIFFIWYYNAIPEKLFNDPTSTVIYDRQGNVLGARIADDGQWRFPHNPHVPEKFEKAIIQFEDRNFYSHIGISFRGIGRAVKQNFSEGRRVSGGSTITMQVVRLMRKGQERTYGEKILEAILATRVEFSYSKEEILAFYASNAPMGGNVVGIDAAAWRYFNRTPDQLSWAESALLAVLPNAPSLIYPGKNQYKLKDKRDRLLDRLFEIGEIDSTTLLLSKTEPLPQKPADLPQVAPHLVNELMKKGHKGERITTTLDKEIQEQVVKILEHHHERLLLNKIYNAACLVIDVNTGEVIAYAGNVENEEKEHGSDVDIIPSARSTGSILKPLLYAGMLNDGIITPKMLVPDVPTHISGYNPKNYNQKYDGAVSANRALARSLNVPAIKMLQQYGIAKFHYQLKKLGLTTLKFSSSHYGLSLVLGGAEASLWDLCSVYAAMARNLNQYPDYKKSVNERPYYISKNVTAETLTAEASEPLLNPAAVWFTFQAMLDVARPEGDENWQNFSSSSKIAWKTGTSFGFRDAWAIGVNPKYVVGIWVGNADGEGRPGLVGIEAAAPILFDVFSRLPKSEWFRMPYDDMEKVPLCRLSGHRASDVCEEVDTTWIPATCSETPVCPYHQLVHLDKTGKYRVDSDCELAEEMIHHPWFVLPPVMEYYYKGKNPSYKTLPEFRSDCKSVEENKPMEILYPKKGSKIHIPVTLEGEKGKTIFEATHRDKSATLFWHLDDLFIGSTMDIHQMEFVPAPGPHKLTIVDDKGNTVSVNFEVRE